MNKFLQAPLLDPGWVSMCKGMDKEPALRRARATLRVARRWAPNPQVRRTANRCCHTCTQALHPAASHQHWTVSHWQSPPAVLSTSGMQRSSWHYFTEELFLIRMKANL